MSPWWLVLGCRATPVATDPPTTPPTPSSPVDTAPPQDTAPPTVPPFDTGPYGPAVGEGSVTVRWDETGRALVQGVFVDDLGGQQDVASCWPQPDRLCPSSASDTWQAAPPFDPTGRTFLGVGPQLLVGPYTADRIADPVLGVRYRGERSTPWPTGSTLGLTFAGGQWSPFVTSAGPVAPEPVVWIRPASGERVRLVDGGAYVLQWVPAEGDHTLALSVFGAQEPGSRPLLHQRLLDDDGHFVLQVDELDLTPANRDLLFVLERRARQSFEVAGNPVTLTAITEATFTATHPPLADRTPLATTGTCDSAPPLPAGATYGTLDFTANDHNPGNQGCTTGATPGRDAVFAVTVEPDERVTIRGDRIDGDASLYLVARCDDLDSCVAVADVAPSGRPETLVYTNREPAPALVYLIADAPALSPDLVYRLDVTYDQPVVTATADRCDVANTVPAVGPGRYTVDLAGAIDHLDPQTGACALGPTDGPDVFLPLDIPAGTTVSVTPEGPVSLYLLGNCVDESTCDAAASRYAPLRWTNPGPEAARRTLVIDQDRRAPPIGPVDLLVEHVVRQTTVAPTCPTTTAPLTTGLHLLDVALTSADHDLPTPSCTFASAVGPDAVVPVRLAPGETLDVQYAHSGEGVVYLLDACTPAATLACDDQVGRDEHLRWTNAGVTTVDHLLVLDTWLPVADPSSSASAWAEVRIQPATASIP